MTVYVVRVASGYVRVFPHPSLCKERKALLKT